MNREFLINILFLICVNLLIKPFYVFGIDRTVQNTVAPGEYGIYFALFNFTFLFQIINDFGIQNYNSRHIAQNSTHISRYFPNILILKGLLGFIYLIVVFIAAIISNYDAHYFILLLPIAFTQILNSLILYLRSNMAGLALYRLDSLISVIDKLLLIIVCSILLWMPIFKGLFKIEWFVYAQACTASITASIAFFIVNKHIKKWVFYFDIKLIKNVLRESFPYGIAIFLMIAYSRIDGVMIERILSDGKLEADVYASAFRLLDASNMIGFLFAGLLLPMFSRLIKDQQPVAPLLRLSFQFIWAGALTLAISTFFFQEEIMRLLYVDGNAYSGQILGYLMFGFVAISGTYIYGTLIGASGNMRELNLISVGGVGLNVILNLILIPKQGGLGAAIATCFTQFFILFAQILIAKKKLSLKFDGILISRILTFIIFTATLTYLLRFVQIELNWSVKFLSSLMIGALMAFLLGLINIKLLTQLFLNKSAN